MGDRSRGDRSSELTQRGNKDPDTRKEKMSDAPKRRTFRKFTFRGIDLEQLLDMNKNELVDLFCARPRRKFQRGLKRKAHALIKKLNKAKKEAPAGEKPEAVRTHLRNMIIVPEMIGSDLGEFSITYKPTAHGRPGIGSSTSSR